MVTNILSTRKGESQQFSFDPDFHYVLIHCYLEQEAQLSPRDRAMRHVS